MALLPTLFAIYEEIGVRLFAKTADFEKYADMEAPDNIERLLRVASAWVAVAVRRATFDVDSAGNPSDPDVVDALRDATCEQVLVWVENDITPGKVADRGAVSSTSIGDASISYETASVTAKREVLANVICDGAYMILDEAGLIGGQPWVMR